MEGTGHNAETDEMPPERKQHMERKESSRISVDLPAFW